ncbi:MAG TPA: fused MFS/spermidine synthase [Rhizomicrobium sp.]|jgi:spermidine synthase|nr:fused MFS/spermidine synthase [Rhizomicrobium sp.]
MRLRSGEIAVVQDNRSGGLSYWQASDHHSVADNFGVSLAPYVHALFGLVRQKHPRRVLIIGCGGGSLATMLAREDVAVTVLDVDPRAFAIARRYFHMPSSVECHLADGARFLRRNSMRYDAIVLDAFVDGRIPRHFLTPNFFRLAKARLRRGGIVLINMVIRGDDDPLFAALAKAVAPVWRYPRLLDVKSFSNRNVIAVAGAVKDLKAPRLRIKPATGARKLAQSLAGFFFRPLR